VVVILQNNVRERKNNMMPSLLAILARFNGDPKQARDYCTIMALTYPSLAEEYQGHAQALYSEWNSEVSA
jgi:hypothetical protein